MGFLSTSRRIQQAVLAEQVAAGAVRADFYASRVEAVAAVPVGRYFSSAETGSLRTYKRIALAPGYLDQGDAAAPVTRAALDTKADVTALATKADVTALAGKADIAALAGKADVAALATKADVTALAGKADIAALAGKADVAALATKADVTALAGKADTATVALKADATAIVAPGTRAGEYDLPTQDYLRAAKPLLKLVPPELRAALLAGENGPNAPDFAPYIQKGLELYRVVDLQGLVVNCKTPIRLSGFQTLLMGGGRLWTNPTDAATAVFDLKPVAAGQQLVVQFHLCGFGSITGSATVFSAKQAYIPGNGVKIVMNDIVCNGLTRRAGTRWIDMELVDFVRVTGGSVSNYDQVLRLDVPAAAVGNRANTQIIIESMAVLHVNSIGYIANSNLVRLNIDVNSFGGALWLGPNNSEMNLTGFHTEAVGYRTDYINLDDEAAGKAKWGWAIYIPDNINFGHITFQDGSIFGTNTIESGTNAGVPIGGVYVGKHDNGTSGVVTFRDFYIAPTSANAPAWIPLEAHYAIRWEGKWISALQNGVRLGNSGAADLSVGDQYTDIVIDEGRYSRRGSRNLLAGTKAINLLEKSGTGTITIAEYTDAPFERGHRITFEAISSTEQLTSVTLARGWHTLLVAGDRITGTTFAVVRAPGGGPILRKPFLNGSTLHPITFHMPFFVETAGAHKIGFQAIANASAVVGEIGVVKGFWPGDIPPGAWTYPPVAALPTASVRWEGCGVTLIAGAADSRIYVCVNTMLGYVWKQIA